ncbi:hypothetical protein OHB04_02655 [Streptomyces sp. NBC_01775]|uniref:hypothetical protein n=1 Tax=Streptomyces sp. NBC_01775 TaxID=2975939 RepID=UPI002DD94E57|nr:hypothetical protein [Streptomyces sp. NBC_01775]WSB74794.1 hypothetical protein OHB04_02655 [Streptomyces sp. NBC_01775]
MALTIPAPESGSHDTDGALTAPSLAQTLRLAADAVEEREAQLRIWTPGEAHDSDSIRRIGWPLAYGPDGYSLDLIREYRRKYSREVFWDWREHCQGVGTALTFLLRQYRALSVEDLRGLADALELGRPVAEVTAAVTALEVYMTTGPGASTRNVHERRGLEHSLSLLTGFSAERVAAAGLLAEQQHLLDPADTVFARLAVEHPEACHTADDYPGWTPGGAA